MKCIKKNQNEFHLAEKYTFIFSYYGKLKLKTDKIEILNPTSFINKGGGNRKNIPFFYFSLFFNF